MVAATLELVVVFVVTVVVPFVAVTVEFLDELVVVLLAAAAKTRLSMSCPKSPLTGALPLPEVLACC
jgi:hypothetical protein